MSKRERVLATRLPTAARGTNRGRNGDESATLATCGRGTHPAPRKKKDEDTILEAV